MGTFEMKVKRSQSVGSTPPPAAPSAAALAPVLISSAVDLAPTLVTSEAPGVESVDESLVYVTSPKVRVFSSGCLVIIFLLSSDACFVLDPSLN